MRSGTNIGKTVASCFQRLGILLMRGNSLILISILKLMDTAFNLISIEASTTLQSTHDDTLENWIIFCENNRRMGNRKNHGLYFNTYDWVAA